MSSQINPYGVPCRNVWKNPNINWNQMTLHGKLHGSPQGRALWDVLVPHLERDAPRVLDSLQKAWNTFLGGFGVLGDDPSWPLPLSGLLPSYLDAWSQEYRMWQAHQLIQAARSPQEDWRAQVASWQEATFRGQACEEPILPEPSIPRTIIPEWVEGQTRLVLLPAPCWNPTWMPAVVQFPAEIFQGMPFCQPLRLQGSGLTLEIDGFRDLAASPAAFDGPKHKSLREWLLDIMHLQGMAWVASPIGLS